MKLPAYASKVSIATLGTILNNLGQWLVLAILTKIADPAYVGLFSIILAISAPVMILGALGLRQAYVTDPDSGTIFHRYFTLRILTTLLSIVVICIWCVAGNLWSALTLWILLAKGLDLLADILLAPFQARGDLTQIGVSQAINGISSPIILQVLLLTNVPLNIATSALTWGSLISLSYVLREYLKVKSFLVPKLDFSGISSLFKTTIPLGLSAMLVSFYANIPRYFLEVEAGLNAVGIYSAIIYFSIAGNAVVAATAQFALPATARFVSKLDFRSATKLCFKASGLFLLLTSIGLMLSYFFGNEILTWVYSERYADSTSLSISILAWGIGAVAWMTEVLLTAMRQFKLQLFASALTLVIMFASSAYLVPAFGIVGATWSMIAGASAQLCFRLIFAYISVRRLTITNSSPKLLG